MATDHRHLSFFSRVLFCDKCKKTCVSYISVSYMCTITGVYHVLTCVCVCCRFGSENVFSCHPDPVSAAHLHFSGEGERDYSALRSVRSEL